jgi:hypothetical protein
MYVIGGWDNSVGIATRYWLDSTGSNPDWGEIFRSGPGAHRASYRKGTASFRGVNRPGICVDHPPTSRPEVKEIMELNLYPPSGPSWTVLGWTTYVIMTAVPVRQPPWRRFRRHSVQLKSHITGLYTVRSESSCALTKGVGSDVQERLFYQQLMWCVWLCIQIKGSFITFCTMYPFESWVKSTLLSEPIWF